jgi:hypothetical protein
MEQTGVASLAGAIRFSSGIALGAPRNDEVPAAP